MDHSPPFAILLPSSWSLQWWRWPWHWHLVKSITRKIRRKNMTFEENIFIKKKTGPTSKTGCHLGHGREREPGQWSWLGSTWILKKHGFQRNCFLSWFYHFCLAVSIGPWGQQSTYWFRKRECTGMRWSSHCGHYDHSLHAQKDGNWAWRIIKQTRRRIGRSTGGPGSPAWSRQASPRRTSPAGVRAQNWWPPWMVWMKSKYL